MVPTSVYGSVSGTDGRKCRSLAQGAFSPMARVNKSRLRKGAIFIESLAAILILTVGVIGLLSMAAVVYQVTERTDRTGIGTSLARRMIEQTRVRGFFGVEEGTVVLYYDVNGANETTADQSSNMYRVERTVTSSAFEANAAGQPVFSAQALRTVTVSVFREDTGALIFQTGTYLSRGGL